MKDITPPYDKIDAALDTLDAIGLSAFAIIGAQNGIRAGMPMVVSAICGMATSTFGGLTRDVVCGRPVRIVHSNAEVYAAPALSGAVTYLFAKKYMASPAVRIGSAFAVCIKSSKPVRDIGCSDRADIFPDRYGQKPLVAGEMVVFGR